MSGKSSKEERVPAPPDGGYGWVVLVASFVRTHKTNSDL